MKLDLQALGLVVDLKISTAIHKAMVEYLELQEQPSIELPLQQSWDINC